MEKSNGVPFVFYPSFLDQIDKIKNDAVRLMVLNDIVRYGCYGEKPDFSSIDSMGLLDAAFEPIMSVIDAAKAGDALALRVSNRVLSMLGHTLAVVANTVNPEALLLGGGVSKAGSFIIDGVRETFERDAFHAVRDTKIVLAKLGNDAGIYGAAYLVIEN